MVENHFCNILAKAEEVSGNSVDCIRKTECNKATSCVIFRDHGSWEELTGYFVKIANETAKIEKDILKKMEV